MSRINWRISSGTFGLPLRDRDFHFQNKRKPARCQPITVSGFTITEAFQNIRCDPIEAGKNETIEILKASRFVDFLRSTLSWWRSATISASRRGS